MRSAGEFKPAKTYHTVCALGKDAENKHRSLTGTTRTTRTNGKTRIGVELKEPVLYSYGLDLRIRYRRFFLLNRKKETSVSEHRSAERVCRASIRNPVWACAKCPTLPACAKWHRLPACGECPMHPACAKWHRLPACDSPSAPCIQPVDKAIKPKPTTPGAPSGYLAVPPVRGTDLIRRLPWDAKGRFAGYSIPRPRKPRLLAERETRPGLSQRNQRGLISGSGRRKPMASRAL